MTDCKFTDESEAVDGKHRYKCSVCNEWGPLSSFGPDRVYHQCSKGAKTSAPLKGSKIARFAKSTAKWVAAGSPVRTDEEVEAILVICGTCEHFNGKRTGCKLCGCRININKSGTLNKARRATEQCPANPPKWGT